MFRQVACGLEYLHLQNIVHGDIKPQNLLVGEDGIVKIADFGISKMLAGDGAREALLETAGTPAFMCPEICGGEPYDGPSADVWALGATMFMLRAGRPPFVADKVVQLYHRIIHDALELPRDVDGALARLLGRMLEKAPGRRATLGQVLGDAWLKAVPRPRPPAERPRPSSRGASAGARALADFDDAAAPRPFPAQRYDKITISAADVGSALGGVDAARPPRRTLGGAAVGARQAAFMKKHSKPLMVPRPPPGGDDDDSGDDDDGGDRAEVVADGGDLGLAPRGAPEDAAPPADRRRLGLRLKAPDGLRNPAARICAAWHSRRGQRPTQEDRVTVIPRAGKESELPNFKGSDLGRFLLVSADFWTSDHLSERSRSVDACFPKRARGTRTLERR